MDYGFKFELGSFVAVAGSCTEENGGDVWIGERSQRNIVVERLLQQCPGGIQRHYVCRGIQANGTSTREYQQFNEIELVASEPFRRTKAREMLAKVTDEVASIVASQ